MNCFTPNFLHDQGCEGMFIRAWLLCLLRYCC